MGGCRCLFRNCKNTTANKPQMHFFHFPVKDRERLHKWIKYADVFKILEREENKLGNRVVCREHFRDECFMNYKKNRITKTAIPTLTVLYEDDKGKVALDYETSEHPLPKRIPLPTAKHLIPPVIETKENNLKRKFTENEPKIINSKIQLLQKNVVCFNLNENKEITTATVQVVKSDAINNQSKENIDLDNFDFEFENCLTKLIDTNEAESIKSLNFDKESSLKSQTLDNENNSNANGTETSKEDEENSNQKIKLLTSELESKSVLINELQNIIKKMERDSKGVIDNLKKEAEMKEKEITKLKNYISIQNNSKINKSSPLTKENLFQSIKKYLCSSMSCLVRMEMFGSSEREWEADEKERSKELLQLGESVFCYFRDEWRFRLPPKKDVEKWLEEN